MRFGEQVDPRQDGFRIAGSFPPHQVVDSFIATLAHGKISQPGIGFAWLRIRPLLEDFPDECLLLSPVISRHPGGCGGGITAAPIFRESGG